jgi:hypothetical protein
MAKQTFQIVEPRAAALVESLRAFGYSLSSAIADLIDNSISAEAKVIRLDFVWDGSDSYVTLVDDGFGMSVERLVTAMRPGSRSPLEDRQSTDLGRFGLGLKTASFSQCRRLTVRSVIDGGRKNTRCWDLDYVNETQEWRLLNTAFPSSEGRLRSLSDHNHGTVVLWEKMDRLVDGVSADDEEAHARFLEVVEEVESHLAMVFHQYLTGPNAIKLFINGAAERNRVRPWSPFLEHQAATQQLQEERIPFKGELVSVRPYVLPHHDKLDKRSHQEGAGPYGWNAQQGFYIYRNRRLLVAGDWLGFPYSKEEHYKLARIRVEISNKTDNDWHIDVKKSVARPPAAIRKQLRRIADITRRRAVEVYRHRGKAEARQTARPHYFAWKPMVRGDKAFYAINREHPLVEAALKLPSEYGSIIRALLRLLEETVPVEQIWLDVSKQETHARPFEEVAEREVMSVIREVFLVLRKKGLDAQQARNHLISMDAFSDYHHLIAAIPDSSS